MGNSSILIDRGGIIRKDVIMKCDRCGEETYKKDNLCSRCYKTNIECKNDFYLPDNPSFDLTKEISEKNLGKRIAEGFRLLSND
jgi:hypothetical protein